MRRTRNTLRGLDTRVVRNLRRNAQIEAWSFRWADHQIRNGWQEYAACRNTDTAAWFDEDKSTRRNLLPLCLCCPVRLDCGAEAVDVEERNPRLVHGFRAGFGPHDRYRAAVLVDRLTQSA